METSVIILYIVCSLVGLVITAWIFKVIAIDPVINELQVIKSILKKQNSDSEITDTKAPTANQVLLQSKYDKGEINFEEYKRQWNKV